MNDTINPPSDAPVADDTRARNREIIFAALAEAGIHRVTVEYDGSGDSGQIESIEAWNAANEKVPLPTIRKVLLPSGNPDSPTNEIGLEAAVAELAWDYLYDSHGGWENNDGAFGTFVFSVPDRTITLEHNERYTEVNTTSHEF
jgi:hypothetical protein